MEVPKDSVTGPDTTGDSPASADKLISGSPLSQVRSRVEEIEKVYAGKDPETASPPRKEHRTGQA